MTARRLDLTPAQYFSARDCTTPCLSQSVASRMLQQSPLHGYTWHPLLGGHQRKTTKAMDTGQLLHSMVLGKGKDVDIIEADSFRTKAAQEARDNAIASGFLPVLRKDYEGLAGAVERIKANVEAAGVRLGGECEVPFEWEEATDDGEIVLCRALMDNVFIDEGLIVDIKKTESAHPRSCGRHVVDYGYDIQHAAYTSCMRKLNPDLAGRERMQFAFIELDEPYAVSALPLNGLLMEMGRMKWQRAVNLWHRCLTTGVWPGYPTTGTLECAPWQMEDEALAAAAS